MGILTSQKIAFFYEQYKNVDVSYNRETIQVIGLQTDQVHLKCVSGFWPCVIYSSSFQGAKVVANVKSALVEKLKRANNAVSLRFCFKEPDQANPLAFFADVDAETRQGVGVLYDLGSTYLGTLPFSRKHETEADEVGLILMIIAGYDSEESIAFWTRMGEAGGGQMPAFLSTHPSNKQRIDNLGAAISNAKEIAGRITQ
ncbi:hypothetical protein FACS1894140_0090 [Spirochaetia bacterium]|nr:hypothetical protein FACS1894140_0090 [Spirochaetia bacterium]